MDKKEFELILEEGEGLKVEFKESFDSKSLGKEIVAFANSEGGRIFLGVSDKKEVKGIQQQEQVQVQPKANTNKLIPTASSLPKSSQKSLLQKIIDLIF